MKRSTPGGLWRPIAIAACLAGIVHIGATFAMPLLAGKTAYARLVATLPQNVLAVLPPITPSSQPLPFLAGDARYAMCRYDTADGPVAVDVTLPDAGWLLALYTPQGDNFYYVTGQAERATRLSLLLIPPGDQPVATDGENPVTRDGAPALVPTRNGLLVVRAPLRGLAYDGLLDAALRTMSCTPRSTAKRL